MKLRAAGVPWTLIARHAAQILGQPVSDVGRLAATLRQRAWSVSVSRPHEIRAGASGAGAPISSSSSGRDQLGGKDSEMPSEKKIIKRTTTTVEEFEPEEEGLDDLDDPDEPDDDEEEGRGKPRSKRPTRAA